MNKQEKTHRHSKNRSKRSKKPKNRFVPNPGVCKTSTENEGELLSQPLSQGRFIAFDIETTGGNPERNGITEICAIRYNNGKAEDSWYSMVNPRIPIPPIVRKMTGITNQMVQDAPDIQDVMPDFINFIGNDILVSHNTVGDLKFLTYYAQTAAGHHLSNFFLCTHLLSEKIYPDAPTKTLTGLGKWFEFELPEEIHRAEADAHVTLKLFKKILETLQEKTHVRTIEEAIRFQGDFESSLRLGWGIQFKDIQDLPAELGCFEFLNAHDKRVYFSSAFNVKSEVQNLRRHIDLPKQLAKQVLSATQVIAHKHDNMLSALKHEIDLESDFSMKYTPHQRHGKWVHTLSVVIEEDGIRFHIGFAPKHAHFVFGPLFDSKTAHTKVQQIADALDVEFKGRKNLVFPLEHKDLLISWFKNTLADSLKTLRRQRFSLKYLLTADFRKDLNHSIGSLEKLEDVQPLENLKDLSKETGTFLIQKGKKKWILPLVNGQLGQQEPWKESFDAWFQKEKQSSQPTKIKDNPKWLSYPALTSWLVWSKRPEKDGIRYIRKSP